MYGPPDAPLAIVAALPEELAPLYARLTRVRRVTRGGFDVRSGTLAGAPVVVARAGDGPRAAALGAAELLGRVEARALVGIGVAGALSPELGVGRLLAARRVRDEAGESFAPDPALLAAALASGATAGSLLSSPRVLVSRAEKRALLAAAGEGYWAADMESISWARAASERSVPWLVIRAVSDRADEELPALLARCVAPDGGGIDRARVAGLALARPGAMPRLLALRRRVASCAEALADAVEALARRLHDSPRPAFPKPVKAVQR